MNDCAFYAVMFVFVHCTANDGILMTKCVVDEFINDIDNFDCVDAEPRRSVSAKDTRTKR